MTPYSSMKTRQAIKITHCPLLPLTVHTYLHKLHPTVPHSNTNSEHIFIFNVNIPLFPNFAQYKDLDYAVQFWSPYYMMDTDRLESIQRRMTINGLRHLDYKDRLKQLQLHSLERRRLRGRPN